MDTKFRSLDYNVFIDYKEPQMNHIGIFKSYYSQLTASFEDNK